MTALTWEIERRLALGALYAVQLDAAKAPVRRLTVRDDRDCVWAQYTIFVHDREALQAKLKTLGVPTAVHYPRPLHRQPAYAAYGVDAVCPRSEQAGAQVMSLPMSADLSDAQLARVVESLVLAQDASISRSG